MCYNSNVGCKHFVIFGGINDMKKRLISIAFIIALIACVIPSVSLPEVSAATAMSNASALTKITYHTGSYVALGKLTIYTSYDGKKSTGKTREFRRCYHRAFFSLYIYRKARWQSTAAQRGKA